MTHADHGLMPIVSRATRHLRDELREHADELVERWVVELSDRLGVRPGRVLPGKLLRNHVPDVLRNMADGLLLPGEQLETRTFEDLRYMAQLRREQGYDIAELLVEFEILSKVIFEALAPMFARFDGTLKPLEGAAITARVSRALNRLGSIAVAAYREAELFERRGLVEQLSELGGAIAHELRNPLNSIKMHVALLRMDPAADAKERDALLDDIDKSVTHAAELLIDLQELVLPDQAATERRRVSVRTVVDTCIEALEDKARQSGVRLEVAGELMDLEGDAVVLELALVNLVSNGIKYADPDKDDRWIRISIARNEVGSSAGWTIAVADNGIGIPEEAQPRIFHRFFRAHPDAAAGTGLGLAILRWTVEAQNGAVWFESKPGQGTTFYVAIPLGQRRGQADRGAVER